MVVNIILVVNNVDDHLLTTKFDRQDLVGRIVVYLDFYGTRKFLDRGSVIWRISYIHCIPLFCRCPISSSVDDQIWSSTNWWRPVFKLLCCRWFFMKHVFPENGRQHLAVNVLFFRIIYVFKSVFRIDRHLWFCYHRWLFHQLVPMDFLCKIQVVYPFLDDLFGELKNVPHRKWPSTTCWRPFLQWRNKCWRPNLVVNIRKSSSSGRN